MKDDHNNVEIKIIVLSKDIIEGQRILQAFGAVQYLENLYLSYIEEEFYSIKVTFNLKGSYDTFHPCDGILMLVHHS